MKKQKIDEEAVNTVERFTLNIKVFNKAVIFVIIIFGLAYLLCVNDLAIKGFKMNELKKNLNKLNEENSSYQLEIMSLKSYNRISLRAKQLNLVPVDKITFVGSDSGLATIR